MKPLLSLFFLSLFPLFSHGIKPVKEYLMRPDKIGLTYEEHKLKTPDGYQLNAWLLRPKQADKTTTIVMAYGDAGNMSYSLAYANGLVQRGYTVLLFDYRGFGESDDFDFDADQYYYNEYAVDLATALRWARSQQRQDRIALWAFSMGTLMATLAYDAAPFDALIAEGMVYSPRRCMRRIKQLKGKCLKSPKGARKVKRKLRKLQIPMLLVAGEKDEVTTLADSLAVAKKRDERRVLRHEGEHLRAALSLGMGVYLDAIEQVLQAE